MAFFDNRFWLLTHIRNSFISSDGTGMCEAVIVDDFPKDSGLFSELELYPQADETDEEDDEAFNSLEHHTEWDFVYHRFRGFPHPADRVEPERKKSINVRHVRWEKNLKDGSQADRGPLFQKKEIKKDKRIGRSLLSLEIENCSLLPKNPFHEYAKYDGSCQTGVPTRTYKIFLTMLPLPDRDYPIQVCILSLAKVSDLVGFTCWKYVMQNPNTEYKFKENVDEYRLYIAEDDGEVDWDFSSLDPREAIGKFGLAYLALVEITNVNIPKEVKVESPFSISEESTENIPIAVDADAAEQFKIDLTAMESLLHQDFRVNMLFKMRGKAEVILGISGDKIELHPVSAPQGKSGSKMWKQKAISHDIRLIVSCEILELKSSGKTVFRIVNYSENDSGSVSALSNYKNNDFEADQAVANEVVKKINNILQVKCGYYRKEYLALKKKKSGRRSNFNIWPL